MTSRDDMNRFRIVKGQGPSKSLFGRKLPVYLRS